MAYNFAETQELVNFIAAVQQDRAKDPSEQNVQCIPSVMGPVGCGKTALASAVSRGFGLPLLNINCGETSDATDITGFPFPTELIRTKQGDYVRWVLNQAMHLAVTQPAVVFFDDIDKIQSLVEGALIGLFGKREVKGYKLHPDTVLLAAGNRIGDDRLARTLSESLRTRMSIIEMEPTLQDFRTFAEHDPTKVHPVVLGFLAYKPKLLNSYQVDAPRFPTQRCWVEASALMHSRKDDVMWEKIIQIACGAPCSRDFSAWYSVVRNIDTARILKTGEVHHTLNEKEDAMVQYAAVFAVAQELNGNGVEKSYKGLEIFLSGISPEMRVAAAAQLSKKARGQIATHFPAAGDQLLKDLIQARED